MNPRDELVNKGIPFSHLVFSDESKHENGRYWGIGAVSCAYPNYSKIKNEIKRLLDESDVTEFEWKKLKTAKYKFAAEKMVDYAIRLAVNNEIRIDVITWDMHDSRHKNIIGRDDEENFARMYFHLYKNILCHR